MNYVQSSLGVAGALNGSPNPNGFMRNFSGGAADSGDQTGNRTVSLRYRLLFFIRRIEQS
jgi:hypothetical protein